MLAFNKIQFQYRVLKRTFNIIQRRRKGVKLYYINCVPKAEDDGFIINYRFRNALFFKWEGAKTIENRVIVYKSKNETQNFELIVYGFMHKKKYSIEIKENEIYVKTAERD